MEEPYIHISLGLSLTELQRFRHHRKVFVRHRTFPIHNYQLTDVDVALMKCTEYSHRFLPRDSLFSGKNTIIAGKTQFITNESDNKLILFERRFDVIFTSFSSSFKNFENDFENDAKMTSKRRSNKINLLSLSFMTKCMSKAFLLKNTIALKSISENNA